MKKFQQIVSFLSIGFMLVCLFSGLVLSFEYDPKNAYESVQKISQQVAYGDFYRKLHYFSGQLFLICSFFHICLEISHVEKISVKSYILALFAFVFTLFLMFSGYVLKGDLSGIFAAEVSFNILESIAIFDVFLPFLKDSGFFFWRYFIWHSILLPFLLLLSLYFHCKIFSKYFLPALAISMFTCFYFAMPKDLAPNLQATNVTGPWFFVGGEYLLQLGISPFFMILNFLLAFMLLICIKICKKDIFKYLFFIWLLFYVLISCL